MRSYMDFKKAKTFVRQLNLKNTKEWNEYCVSKKKPSTIPSSPMTYYEEWKGINDWLGTRDLRGGMKRKYSINDNYFKTWTDDMAYILGFWWADGSISINKNSYQFNICQKEKYILESILTIMKCNPIPIRPHNGSYVFSIASKPIVTDIIALGGTPRKSLKTSFPKIPTQYLKDFIRGFFDGDGCIYFSTKNQFYKSKITCGCEEFLYELHSALKKEIPLLKGSIEEAKPTIGKNNVYHLHFGSSDTTKLAKYLYLSSSPLRLKRKYDMFTKSIETNFTYPDFYSYEELKTIIKKQNINNLKELFNYRKTKKNYRIPSTITYYGQYYKGANNLFRKFLSYNDAHKCVSGLNIKGVKEWREWVKTNNRPTFIHSNPHKYYKKSGWVSYTDFLKK